MIKVILFDVGNVLLTFNPKEFYKDKYDEETLNTVFEVMFSGDAWHLYDQGVYDEEDLKKLFIKQLPDHKDTIAYLVDNIAEVLSPIEEMVNLALELKQDYRISILSNMPKKSLHYIVEEYDFFKMFENPLWSYEHKLIKPDFAIFKLQLERLNVKAQECLFIDDLQRNIEAAAALGFKTVRMTSPEETINQVKQLLERG